MDTQQQIDTNVSVQAKHEDRISGLIRVAELQQENLERLERTVAADHVHAEAEHALRREEEKRIDQRIDNMVSAIGELIRRFPQG